MSRSFEPQIYYHGGKIQYIGPPVPPAPNEAGWKDTVQAHPGMVTRIITRFEVLPDATSGTATFWSTKTTK